jgi:hypothetical protein
MARLYKLLPSDSTSFTEECMKQGRNKQIRMIYLDDYV